MSTTLTELQRLHDAVQSGQITVEQIKDEHRSDYEEYVANLATQPTPQQQPSIVDMNAFELLSEAAKGVGEVGLSMATARS